jgi:hypothetical protein
MVLSMRNLDPLTERLVSVQWHGGVDAVPRHMEGPYVRLDSVRNAMQINDTSQMVGVECQSWG